MITRQIIKARGSASGVIDGFTFEDQIQWSLDIKLPRQVSLKNRPIAQEILVRSIGAAISNSHQPHTQDLKSFESDPTYGKMCGTCEETYVHKTKCPNSTMPLRRFE